MYSTEKSLTIECFISKHSAECSEAIIKVEALNKEG